MQHAMLMAVPPVAACARTAASLRSSWPFVFSMSDSTAWASACALLGLTRTIPSGGCPNSWAHRQAVKVWHSQIGRCYQEGKGDPPDAPLSSAEFAVLTAHWHKYRYRQRCRFRFVWICAPQLAVPLSMGSLERTVDIGTLRCNCALCLMPRQTVGLCGCKPTGTGMLLIAVTTCSTASPIAIILIIAGAALCWCLRHNCWQSEAAFSSDGLSTVIA